MNSMPLNFYPGPSKLYPQVKEILGQAYDSGILSCNHRSPEGMELISEAIQITKQHLNIPSDYHLYFTSSATECWEIVSQSLLRGKVQFLYNGAFGKKWFKYAVLNPSSGSNLQLRGSRFEINQTIANIEIDPDNDCICAVSNETSNGTQIANNELDTLRKNHPKALICLDATSGLGGRDFDIKNADVWFASTQKCFGLPAGLGLLIVSPRTIEKAIEINDKNYYNSLLFIHENFQKSQTHYTPNMLGIYTLKNLLTRLDNCKVIAKKNKIRASYIYQSISEIPHLQPLVNNPDSRSETVISCLHPDPKALISTFKAKGITLGKGYGEWLDTTFRIANFPAILDEEYQILLASLKNNSYEF